MTGTQLNRWTGVVLLVGAVTGALALTLPLAAVGGFPEDDPNAVETIRLLQEISANDLIYLAGYAFDAVANLTLVALAPLLYLLLGGRRPPLAALAGAMFGASGVVLMIVTVLAFSAHSLASDLPAGLPSDAGQLATAIEGSVGLTVIVAFADSSSSLSGYGAAIGYGFLGVALILLGWLLARAPASGAATEAASRLPAWIGWMSVAAGVLLLCYWPALAVSGFGLLTLIGYVLTVATVLALGVRLAAAGEEPATAG